MATIKRKSRSVIKKSAKKRKTSSRASSSRRSSVRSIVSHAISANIETKCSGIKKEDGAEILHNANVFIDNELLKTTQGVADPETISTGNRIGDRINLKGISLKFMFELNERYSDVTFRLMVIKSSRGDAVTRASIFTGLCNNKMMDTFNHERFTLVAQKWFKIRAPNNSALGALGAGGAGSGINASGANLEQIPLSRATKIVKMWLPGKKFSKNGIIVYDNGGSQQKFFDYNVVCYAYSNFSTSQDLYNVGRLNTYIKQMYFKDA